MIAFGINKEMEKTKLLQKQIEDYKDILKVLNNYNNLDEAKKFLEKIIKLLEWALSMRGC